MNNKLFTLAPFFIGCIFVLSVIKLFPKWLELRPIVGPMAGLILTPVAIGVGLILTSFCIVLEKQEMKT